MVVICRPNTLSHTLHVYAHIPYIIFSDMNQNMPICVWARVSRLQKAKNAPIDLVLYQHPEILSSLPFVPTYISIYLLISIFLFSSKVTMVLICHTIIDTTVNLKLWEDGGKNLSQLIYETSLTIDTRAKSNVKGSLVTFVRAIQWIQSACGFPVKEK